MVGDFIFLVVGGEGAVSPKAADPPLDATALAVGVSREAHQAPNLSLSERGPTIDVINIPNRMHTSNDPEVDTQGRRTPRLSEPFVGQNG
jgi:hypothetical protein